MKIEGDTGGDSKKTPGPQQSQQKPAPGSKEFSQVYREMEQAAGRQAAPPRKDQPAPSPLKPQPKRKEKIKEKKKPKQKNRGQVQQQSGQQQQGAVKLDIGAAQGTRVSSQVDQLARFFETTPVYGAKAVQVQASALDNGGATILVALSNGVSVQVDIHPGGRDLNVVIRGLSAKAQAAMDNLQNQSMLQNQLRQQGFVVQTFQTFREEGPKTEAGATPHEGGEEGGAGGEKEEEQQK